MTALVASAKIKYGKFAECFRCDNDGDSCSPECLRIYNVPLELVRVMFSMATAGGCAMA